MKYVLAINSNPVLLEYDVNRLLKEGWALQGGVSMTHNHNQLAFAQALIKEIKD